MSTPYFQFKQFTVWHDKCAMKVGTDGVLLGAWSPYPELRYVRALDIGTGCGLIALMIAQRLQRAGKRFAIQGIDCNTAAVNQAIQNFRRSPWADYMTCTPCALQDFQASMPYQLIVSNPPFFRNSLKNPDPNRAMARHTDSLSYEELFSCSVSMLSDDGMMSVIVPAEAEAEVLDTAAWQGLLPMRIMHVRAKPKKAVKRVLIAFGKAAMVGPVKPRVREFVLEASDAPRSEEYIRLTKDFYVQSGEIAADKVKEQTTDGNAQTPAAVEPRVLTLGQDK